MRAAELAQTLLSAVGIKARQHISILTPKLPVTMQPGDRQHLDRHRLTVPDSPVQGA